MNLKVTVWWRGNVGATVARGVAGALVDVVVIDIAEQKAAVSR
jgi:hypothetical protein